MKNLALLKKSVSIIKPNGRMLSILECLLFLNNKVTVTDSQTYITFKNTGIDGDFCLSAKEFFNAAQLLPSFEVSKTGDGVTISGDGDVFKFATDDIDDFPCLPNCLDFDLVGVLAQFDLNRIATASKFISNDELRPALCHVAINAGHIFGTDAHRLFFEPCDIKTEQTILINKKTTSLLGLFPGLQFSLSVSGDYLEFENDEVIIYQKICNERCRAYLDVIPQNNPIKIEVCKKDIQAAVKKGLTVANMVTKQIRMHLNGALSLSAEDIDFNRSYAKTIPAKITGGEIEIGFNGDFLTSVFADTPGDMVNFECSTPNRAAIFNGNILLMPVMLNSYN